MRVEMLVLMRCFEMWLLVLVGDGLEYGFWLDMGMKKSRHYCSKESQPQIRSLWVGIRGWPTTRNIPSNNN